MGVQVAGKVLFNVASGQREVLREIAYRQGASVSEVLRRMIDHCSREHVVGAVFPAVSGSVFFGR